MTFFQLVAIVGSFCSSISCLTLLDERYREGNFESARLWLIAFVILSALMWMNILMVAIR
jgi:hypothetical protein